MNPSPSFAVEPLFERAEVELEADDREPRVLRRPDIDVAIEDAHQEPLFGLRLPWTYSFTVDNSPADAFRVTRL